MKISVMLQQMCHSLLAATDVKQLCKTRGFPPDAVAAPGILETLFLSPQGVADAFGKLEADEICALHQLRLMNKPVDVSFFSRVYSSSVSNHGTFNQRYQNLFSTVKQRLIRNGLLVWCEVRQDPDGKQSKLERTWLTLPSEFYSEMPPLFSDTHSYDGPGDHKATFVQERIVKELNRSASSSEQVVFAIKENELSVLGGPLNRTTINQWRLEGWGKELVLPKSNKGHTCGAAYPSEAVVLILSQLQPGAWANVESITRMLKLFSGLSLDASAICEPGYKWGLLAKRRENGTDWFRMAPPSAPSSPADYLRTSVDPADQVFVDLRTIPIYALEAIVAVSDQFPSKSDSASLRITPNLLKISRASDVLLSFEPVAWLFKHAEAFKAAESLFRERRGETILHSGMLIAKVNDLSLKMSLKKTLQSDFLALENDFIAFPPGQLTTVERLVKKSGHVVKEMKAK